MNEEAQILRLLRAPGDWPLHTGALQAPRGPEGNPEQVYQASSTGPLSERCQAGIDGTCIHAFYGGCRVCKLGAPS